MKINYSKKILIIIFLALLFTDCSSYRISRLMQNGKPANNMDVTTIPFVLNGNSIIIKAHINNSKTDYNLLLDTGAWTSINKDLAEKLSLQNIEEMNVVDISGKKIPIYLTTLENISIDKTIVTNCPSIIADLKLKFGSEIDGILGSNFLRFFKVTIDYEKKTISFTRNIDMPINTGDIVVPFQFDNFFKFAPNIECQINDIKIRCTIDTGFGGYLSLPESKLKELKKDNTKDMIKSNGGMSTGLIGYCEQTYLMQNNTLEIGKFKVDKLPIISHSNQIPSGLIGNEFLSNFLVILNYQSGNFILRPTKKIITPTYYSYGLSFIKKDNKVLVNGIWDNSPADKNGIKIGDEIVIINSQNVNDLSFYQLYNIFTDKNINTMDLIYLNNNDKKSIKLVKENLLKNTK